MKLPRHAEIWLPPYVINRGRRWLATRDSALEHVWVAITDHYEPFWGQANYDRARKRVEAWRRHWPQIAAEAARYSRGVLPKYTFFYPQEQYHPELLDVLAEMTREGIADVEVHIHHDGEGRKDFVSRVSSFCRVLAERHGLLRRVSGRVQFGFIHGNWALDNSLPNGRWCGLNDEITILRDLGCYADFTMPSGASPTQARTINSIYWCTDDPQAPKSYDRGTVVCPGLGKAGDLLIIPGPLGLRWRGRLVPRLETGELASYDLPTAYRVRRWFDLAPRIASHAFIKLYSHGARDDNLEALLGAGLRNLFRFVYEEGKARHAAVHFVSAWEMYLAIEGLGSGRDPHVPVPSESSKSYSSVAFSLD